MELLFNVLLVMEVILIVFGTFVAIWGRKRPNAGGRAGLVVIYGILLVGLPLSLFLIKDIIVGLSR